VCHGRQFLVISRDVQGTAPSVIEFRIELPQVDRALRRAMLICHGFAVTLPSSAERSIHLSLQLMHSHR
jgi:hypothetical protein